MFLVVVGLLFKWISRMLLNYILNTVTVDVRPFGGLAAVCCGGEGINDTGDDGDGGD